MAEAHETILPKSKAQMRALDAIGCGNNSPIMARATRKALLDAGLIYQLSDRRIGTGPFAAIIEQFEMPLHVHLAWCTSCDDAEEPATPTPATRRHG